jgi:hypothetical protein
MGGANCGATRGPTGKHQLRVRDLQLVAVALLGWSPQLDRVEEISAVCTHCIVGPQEDLWDEMKMPPVDVDGLVAVVGWVWST